ncbi:hypothetical protein C5L31_000128 [Secundilactobacillus malefermentans]|uniref:Helicase n=1 Tax=Secundilactobacillus malefermentans TaxID=176292 RepID=A0A4R5NR12_9LACO
MDDKIESKIEESVLAGYVDRNKYALTEEFRSQLINNRPNDNMYFHINDELDHCSGFTFAVAFVSENILTPLKAKIADISKKGVKGRILTSNYLNFNQPKAFRELLKLPNVEVRVLEKNGFHAKGYMFEHGKENYQSVIIGSSNLTRNALIQNYEWNLRFSSFENSDVTNQICSEMDETWGQAIELTDEWIDNYEITYNQSKPEEKSPNELNETKYIFHTIVPNVMQNEALKSLKAERLSGAQRALIVSATGTGKTFLGAFDVKQFEPKRFLFVVHREQILKKSLESFYKVIGGNRKDYGLFTGNRTDSRAKYLFASIQTLSKPENYELFDPKDFDYILIDEVHRAGAKSYQNLINYFKPNFLLGMTATPERTDGYNLYELFDYNIAYEIRLKAALEENMLCPFHYIGVTDYEVDGVQTSDLSDLKWLASDERVAYILKQVDYFGYSGEKVHGLIFCSSVKEAQALAENFTKKNHRAVALSGSTSQMDRDSAVKQLESGEIEYIITVDIFNEGIDIPCVNQVVLLRNTQSSIVFIQQLGRGLRKAPDKDFVNVIDFIGDYKNNYLIPIALTGDKTRSKNKARDTLTTQQLIGVSTISFSKIVKERIYEAINTTNLTAQKELVEDYKSLKFKIGRSPLLSDFQKWGSVDPMVFANKFNNYNHFLKKVEENRSLSESEDKVLTFVTKE